MTLDELRNTKAARLPENAHLFGRADLPAANVLPNPEQRQRQETLAEDCPREAPGAGCLHVRFTLRRRKLLDVDAKYASVKDVLDCLWRAKVVRGDREGEITLEVNQLKAAKGEAECTIVEVYEP